MVSHIVSWGGFDAESQGRRAQSLKSIACTNTSCTVRMSVNLKLLQMLGGRLIVEQWSATDGLMCHSSMFLERFKFIG